MTLDQAMARLQGLGNEQMRKINIRNGASENQFGAKMGDIRSLAKEIKTNPELAKELWATGNWDARLLATQLMKPKQLTMDEVDQMVRDIYCPDTVYFSQLCDWVMTNVVKVHPQKEELRQKWMADKHPMAARAGWSLTSEMISKGGEGLDLEAILDRLEREMPSAHPMTQWTMNFALGNIGIHHPTYRQRALEFGEKLGLYRDYPVSKGCTSPFVPIWVNEMVGRQG